jgi:hypothetical protein
MGLVTPVKKLAVTWLDAEVCVNRGVVASTL